MDYLKKTEEILREQLGTPNETAITPETKLIEDLGCDSLDVVEIIMAFEDDLCIQIHDEEGEKCRTVADIIALLESKPSPSNDKPHPVGRERHDKNPKPYTYQ